MKTFAPVLVLLLYPGWRPAPGPEGPLTRPAAKVLQNEVQVTRDCAVTVPALREPVTALQTQVLVSSCAAPV